MLISQVAVLNVSVLVSLIETDHIGLESTKSHSLLLCGSLKSASLLERFMSCA